jgi:ELWxxDGT repeat protein
MKTVYTLIIFLFFSTLKTNAQNFHLVKDINRTTNSSPTSFKIIKGIKYFAADDGIHGSELWRSDGTAQGTWMIADINKGDAGSNPSGMTEGANNIIYFKAYTEEYGFELWRTNGTAAGTKMIKDIYPGSESGLMDIYADDSWFIYVNGSMFFIAQTKKEGSQLWKTDGTAKGTVMVNDPAIEVASSPNNLTAYKGKIYFFASGKHADSLYTSDGTQQGTYGLKAVDRYFVDIWSYTGILVMNNILYFTASPFNSNGNNIELWRSDGTAAGTYIVKDINPSFGSTPNSLIANNNILYFSADDGLHSEELWKSDGTAAGTSLVYDIDTSKSSGSMINDIVVFHDSIFYYYQDYTNTKLTGLWKSNGTSTGTVKAIDYKGTSLTSLTFALVFIKGDSLSGYELWQTNGTQPATLVKDINPGNYDGLGAYQDLFADSDFVYFQGTTLKEGQELWKSNGTGNETVMVKDINTSGSQGASIKFLPNYNNKVFFTAYTSKYGEEPYISDGTAQGTYMLKKVVPGFQTANIINTVTFKDTLYFQELNNSATPKPVYNWYQSDGTPANTVLINQTQLKSANFTAGKNNLYFSYADPTTGNELYKTTTNPKKSVLVKDIWPGSKGSSPSSFIIMDNVLYFTAADSIHGEELWRSNGNASGTSLVVDLIAGYAGSVPSKLYVYNHRLYFHTPLLDYKIWISDGTAAGTRALIDSVSGQSLSDLQNTFVGSGEFVYFSAYSSRTGYQLWKTNGQSNKATLVKDNLQGQAFNLTDVNGILYFTLNQYGDGPADYLWRTDGTAAGTYLLKDIFPGNTVFGIFSLVNAGGTLAFLAETLYDYNSQDSSRLWTSDGTAAGTIQINDTALSNINIISSLVAINDSLYFEGRNKKYGEELWTGIIIKKSFKENLYAKKESLPSAKIEVYPNPFSDKLFANITLATKQIINVSILDAAGKTVLSQKINMPAGNTQITFNMRSYNSGTYFLRVTNNQNTSTTKIFKLQ